MVGKEVGLGVGRGVGSGVGTSVGTGVGDGVGLIGTVGLGVGCGVVGFGVGCGVVGLGVGSINVVGVGATNKGRQAPFEQTAPQQSKSTLQAPPVVTHCPLAPFNNNAMQYSDSKKRFISFLAL